MGWTLFPHHGHPLLSVFYECLFNPFSNHMSVHINFSYSPIYISTTARSYEGHSMIQYGSTSGYTVVFLYGAMCVGMGCLCIWILRKFAGTIIRLMMMANFAMLSIATIYLFGVSLIRGGLFLLS